MKRVTIYVDEHEWQGVTKFVLKESARIGKRVSIGAYLIDLHKGNKVYKSEPIEIKEKIKEPVLAEAPLPTGGNLPTGVKSLERKSQLEVVGKKKDIIKNFKSTGFFNPQPKKG